VALQQSTAAGPQHLAVIIRTADMVPVYFLGISVTTYGAAYSVYL